MPELFENKHFNIHDDLSLIEIRKTKDGKGGYICRKDKYHVYDGFLLYKSEITIICNITFHKSSISGFITPRLTFKQLNAREGNTISINFNSSERAIPFWKLIDFLKSFKDIVYTGDFDKSFKVVSKEAYFIEFKNKEQKEKIQDLKELIEENKISEANLKETFNNQRKETIKCFYNLLKDNYIETEKKHAIEFYREDYNKDITDDKKKIGRGDEAVWHHFLKTNDWILGLNVDIKFIGEFIDEPKVGIENSKGQGSPGGDVLGLSNYTTLIEFKTAKTKIFKERPLKGNDKKTKKNSHERANTWAFTPAFIEGISQCLGQKSALTDSYPKKDFTKNDGDTIVDDKIHRNLDPKTIFIIGSREKEFPHSTKSTRHSIKSETFERYRRNSRNVDIITYDELFERAYHIVFSKKIKKNWYSEKEIENI